MQIKWNDKEPIYRQLRDKLVELILEGVFQNGDPLPSVRQVSSEHRINPITVSKAFQMLVDDDLIEKRRGVGMFVVAGARERLIVDERERFISEDWPQIIARIERLGLDPLQLINQSET
ncbi:MAG: GntR family transcriptional regulator [Gammaproteobacteria bacterium]|nr:GntR family transcriptional regulator [Gammaproteobacteria bacterium]